MATSRLPSPLKSAVASALPALPWYWPMQSAQWVGQTSRSAHPPRTLFAQRNQPAALGLHPAESMRAALCADARRPSPVRHSGGLRYTLACRIGSFERVYHRREGYPTFFCEFFGAYQELIARRAIV